MLDLTKISGDVLSCIEENAKDVAHCSVEEAFDAYLTWQGVMGYTRDFIEAYEEIKNADVKNSAKMDILDLVWEILVLVKPDGYNVQYVQILAATGRLEELRIYLNDYAQGRRQG